MFLLVCFKKNKYLRTQPPQATACQLFINNWSRKKIAHKSIFWPQIGLCDGEKNHGCLVLTLQLPSGGYLSKKLEPPVEAEYAGVPLPPPLLIILKETLIKQWNGIRAGGQDCQYSLTYQQRTLTKQVACKSRCDVLLWSQWKKSELFLHHSYT